MLNPAPNKNHDGVVGASTTLVEIPPDGYRPGFGRCSVLLAG